MTGDILLDLAISLGGIAALVAASWLLGGWRTAWASLEAARERLAFDEPDFAPADWCVGVDGKAAAAIDAGGALAVVFVVGDSLATRRLAPGAVDARVDGSSVVVRLGDISRRDVRLAAADEREARAWLGRLGGRR